MTLRLLHVTRSAAPEYGGPIAATLDQHAVTKGSVSREIVTCDPPGAGFTRDFPLTLHAFGTEAGSRRPPMLGRALARYGRNPAMIPWLKANVARFDAVVVDGLWNYATWAAARVLPRAGVPYVVFPHGMLDPWFNRQGVAKYALRQGFWTVCEGPLLRGAARVFFTAEDEHRLARGALWFHGDFDGQVVPFGVREPPAARPDEAAAFRRLVPGLGARPYLLYLGRVHPKKGADMLIEAFAQVARAHPETDLVIAGPEVAGWGDVLRGQAARLGIAGRLHWPGMLRGPAKWGAFRGAEAFVLPSHQENFGLVIAEAMACATPVLTTRRVNIWREVEASGGALVREDTPAGTEDMLARFLAMPPGARAAMGARARAGFEAHFQLERTAGHIVEAIREAIDSKGSLRA